MTALFGGGSVVEWGVTKKRNQKSREYEKTYTGRGSWPPTKLEGSLETDGSSTGSSQTGSKSRVEGPVKKR